MELSVYSLGEPDLLRVLEKVLQIPPFDRCSSGDGDLRGLWQRGRTTSVQPLPKGALLIQTLSNGAHWKQHKRKCKATALCCEPEAGSVGLAGSCEFSCPECARPRVDCVCIDPPVCRMCLESGGELLRGCACRGTAGYVHVACMVKANRHRKIAHEQCPTCEQRFVGALSVALAEVRVRETRASGSDIDPAAMNALGWACFEQGRYDEALGHYRNLLRHALQHVGGDHVEVAKTKVCPKLRFLGM